MKVHTSPPIRFGGGPACQQAPPATVVRCRYLDRHNDQCTGEAVDPLGEVLLCTRHLARALELVQAHTRKARS